MSVDAFPAHESTRKRRRWGCTCGCLFLLIGLLFIGSLFTYYSFRSNRPYQRYALMDPNVNGFGVLRLDSSDQGISEMTRIFFKRVEEAQKAGLSETDAKIVSSFIKVSRNFVTSFVQSESPIYLSYNPDAGTEAYTAVLPLKNRLSVILLRQFLKSNVSTPISREGEVDIYRLGPTEEALRMGVAPGEVLLSNSEDMFKRSLEYRAQPRRSADPSERLQRFIEELSLDQPPGGEDLAIALVNEPGRLQNLLQSLEKQVGATGLTEAIEGALAAQKVKLDDVSGLKASVDLASADRLTAEVTVFVRQADIASRFAIVLKEALQRLHSPEGSPLKVKTDVRTRGSATLVTVELDNLRTWLNAILPPAPPSSAADSAAPLDSAADESTTAADKAPAMAGTEAGETAQ